MRSGCANANLGPMNRFGRRRSVKPPGIKTLNQQIDDIEADTTPLGQT